MTLGATADEARRGQFGYRPMADLLGSMQAHVASLGDGKPKLADVLMTHLPSRPASFGRANGQTGKRATSWSTDVSRVKATRREPCLPQPSFWYKLPYLTNGQQLECESVMVRVLRRDSVVLASLVGALETSMLSALELQSIIEMAFLPTSCWCEICSSGVITIYVRDTQQESPATHHDAAPVVRGRAIAQFVCHQGDWQIERIRRRGS